MEYKKYPLSISVVDPFLKKNSKIFYFLGNVPSDVLNAAKEGIFNKQTGTTEWSSSSKKILKEYYGINWHAILTGYEPSMELNAKFNIYKYVRRSANALVLGGSESLLFGDMSAFDNEAQIVSTKEIKTTSNLLFTSSEKIVYTNLSIYPEDTIFDLRMKAQLITRIPIYRQFIFYFIDDYGPYYTFQITVNRVPYTIKWEEITRKYDLTIDGIGIDIYFEQNKGEIEISSYDRSVLLESKSGHRINKVYIIDLFDIIKGKNITDKYQFNLIYYGFIIKYWPQLTPELFKIAMTESDKIYTLYPLLSYDFDELYRNQTTEQMVFNSVHKYVDTKSESVITNASIIVNPKALKMNINIRNIFDQLVLSSKVNGMFMNILYGIRKQYYIQKRHASILNQDFIINTPKNTLAICIEGIQQIVLTISKSGTYEVSTQWLESDNITFENIIKSLSIIVNPVIESINKLGIYVFPNGGQLNAITKDAVFNLLTLSVYYNFSFSTYEFNLLKNYFKKYEMLNIIKVYGLQVSRVFTFVFYRGIVNFNTVDDSYNWLYGESIQNGRRIRIIHRSDRLQVEMNNIQSIEEYNTIKKYIFSLIEEFIKTNKLKKLKKKETDVKAIRKLHDLDPELFNLAKYDSDANTYSVLCQSQRQPSIYEEEDLKYFSKDKLNKVVKYWNFTYNRPAYYLCEGKYQYINFIVDKHPKKYCLPCCKKLKDIPNTDVARINEECLKNKSYKSEKIDSNYTLAYGKKLIVGRRSHVPSSLKYLLPDHFIMGVKQNESNDTNIGFIESITYILGDVISELAVFVKEMDQYYTLANGKANKFKSSDELYSEMLSNFKIKNNMLLTNVDIQLWKHIITDLIRHKLGIEVLEIINKDNQTTLHAYESLLETNVEKVIILFTDLENGTNPIVSNTEKIFDSAICKYLFVEKTKKLTLNYIKTIAHKRHKEISMLLINMKGLCYAVIIDDVYLPIVPSYYSSNKNLYFDVRPEPDFSRQRLLNLIEELGIDLNIEYIIRNKKDIGFIDSSGLVFYHRPEESDESIKILSNAYMAKKIFIPYDLRSIDSAILKRNIIKKISNTGLVKKLENNYYNLFLSEFIHQIQKEKNDTLRNNLKHLLSGIDFLDSKSIQNINIKLSELLSEYPIDLLVIYDYIENAYFTSNDIKSLSSFIDSSRFEFDYQILHDLKAINDKDKLIKKLKDVMKDSYITGEIKNIPQYYNIFTSCSKEGNQFFCKEDKLVIPSEKIEDFFDILSNDIMNKSRTYILMASSSGIFNFFDFIKRPYEFIEISENKL